MWTLILSAVIATNVWLLLYTLSHRTSLTGRRGRLRLVILLTVAILVILSSLWAIILLNK